MKCCLRLVLASVAVSAATACSAPRPTEPGVPWYPLAGPLVPAHMTMVTAWDVPKNPLTDTRLDDSKLSKEIRKGYRIFMGTPAEAPRLTGGSMSCGNCHLNAGQREKALPVVGIAQLFPEYNRRAGRLFSLADRVVDCFLRSENGAAGGEGVELAQPDDPEVLAVSAYLAWLSNGITVGQPPPWRGQNTIAKAALIPVNKLDPKRGEELFMDTCTNCHGRDGQGVQVGDMKPGPLWGPGSWNDGAGAARVYTLAGIIRYMMPYLAPGSLTDEEAQQIAAFITSQPRPSYPYKDQDYLVEPLPSDAVYYRER
jgi:thiosulfate dehydrogenase